MQEIIKEIKNIIEDILRLGTFSDFEINIKESKTDELTVFDIQIEDAKFLIGEKGKNLDALNFIVKAIVLKKFKEAPRFLVDVNNYKRDRINTLKELAKTVAQRVVLTKVPFELPSMSAFERRIIHLELSTHPNIKTESQGEGNERHIVVMPI